MVVLLYVLGTVVIESRVSAEVCTRLDREVNSGCTIPITRSFAALSACRRKRRNDSSSLLGSVTAPSATSKHEMISDGRGYRASLRKWGSPEHVATHAGYYVTFVLIDLDSD